MRSTQTCLKSCHVVLECHKTTKILNNELKTGKTIRN